MRRDTLQDLLIGLALFALAFWHNLAYVPLTDFHRDEARWLHRSYFLEELFHPSSDLWRTDSLLTMGQPPLGNYLMGLGLLVQGRDLKPNGLYDMNHGQAWNRARGNIPAPGDLHAGRRTNAFVGALTVLCVYYIGRRLANRVAGFVGALILIPHPLNTYLSTFAGSDALLVFFVAAATLTAIALADRPTWPRAILVGVLLGLGGATKISPLVLALPLAGLGLALVLHGAPARFRWTAGRQVHRPFPPSRPLAVSSDLGWMLLTVPVVAFAAFVLVYPYLWADPIGRTKRIYDFRTHEMETQGELWANTRVSGPYDGPVDDVLAAIDRVDGQLGERTSTSRWLAAEFEERFGRSWNRPDLDLKLGALGLLLLGAWALMHGPRSRYALAAIVVVGEAAIILVGMQVDFNRYHLPILLAVVVGCGFLAGQLWNGLVLLAEGAALVWSRLAPASAGPAPEDVGIPTFDQPDRGGGDFRPARAPGALLASHVRAADPGRLQPLLVAAALALGVLIGHSWAGLRSLTRNGRRTED